MIFSCYFTEDVRQLKWVPLSLHWLSSSATLQNQIRIVETTFRDGLNAVITSA